MSAITDFPEVKVGSVWLTPHQQKVDLLALSLLGHPAVKAARAEAEKRYRASPEWAVADAPATLARAIDNMLFSTLQVGANRDPSRPGVVWSARLQYRFGEHLIPSTNHGLDSPDRAYRLIGVSPEYRYEISGRRHPSHPTPIDSLTVESLRAPSYYGQPLVTLKRHEIDITPEGTFTIVADSTPANGRRNHLQLPAGTTNIIVRDTFHNWAQEIANRIEVVVLEGPSRPERTLDQVATECVDIFNGCVERNLAMIQYLLREQPANRLIAFERPVHWGMSGNLFAANRFELADDEALLITIDPLSAWYFTIALGDPWSGALPYDSHSSCLNNASAQPNQDGKYTFVISPRDPGVFNWLDTLGLRTGSVFARWESTSKAPLANVGTSPDYGDTRMWAPEKTVAAAVPEYRLLRISQVAAAIPPGQARVTPEERRKLQAARRAAHLVRMRDEVVAGA